LARILFVLAGLIAAAAPLTVRDVDGKSWWLLAPPPGRLDVLFFISPDCPISNRYAPEIERMCSEYQSRGVRCFAIYPDAADEGVVRRHRQEYAFSSAVPAILDRKHELVRAAGARVTPEAALFSVVGQLYRGRIDDLYVDIGRARRTPTRHDVRLVLDAVLANRPVPQPTTEAVGCTIQTP
jgi:hypothetical protein